MKIMFRFILTAIALVAAAFNASAQTGSVPNLLMVSVGSPTITMTNTSSSNGAIATQVTATFIASLKAQNGDITIGLPAANLPLVTAQSPSSVAILKNGVADTSTAYSTTISFIQPPSGVVAGSGSTFILQKDNTTNVPITVSFIVINGAGNVYAVQLGQFYWTDSGGKNTSTLTGPTWTTPSVSPPSGGGTVTPVVPAVPDYVSALRSTADLSAYIAATARSIDIYVSAASQIGGIAHKEIKLTGPATTRAIDQAIRNAAMQISVSSAASPVYYEVEVHTSDYRIALSGSASQTPISTKDGLAADFKLKLSFQGDILMLVPNIAQATLKKTDATGSVTSAMSLPITAQGFYISPRAVGDGLLEIIVNDGSPTGKVETYDLRRGTLVVASRVSATASVAKENVEYVLDKTEINLIPETTGGRGKNVLGEIELTKTTTVSIAAMTTEGKKALTFRYRQISPVFTAAWSYPPPSVVVSNGIMSLSLTAGDWQVIPEWDPKDLSEPPYEFPTYGKGSVDGATN